MVDSSPDGEDAMFSSGVGSQVMHASVSSPTKEMLFAEGRRYLEDDHLWVVKARLSEVRTAALLRQYPMCCPAVA